MLSGTWRRGWRCFAPRIHLHPSNNKHGCSAQRRCFTASVAINYPRNQLKGKTAEWLPSLTGGGGGGAQPSFPFGKFDKNDQKSMLEDVMQDATVEHPEGWEWATDEQRERIMREHEENKKEEEQERRKEVDERLKDLSDLQRDVMKKFAFRLELAQKYPKKYDTKVWDYFRIICMEDKMVKVLGELAWEYLWNLETDDVPQKRRIDLVEVMLRCDIPVTEKHARGYIEALYWHEDRSKAMAIWESQLEDNESLKWWNLGVKMFATEGDPATAERIADDAVKKLGVANAMTYTPAIVAYLGMIEATGLQKGSRAAEDWKKEAKRAYRKLEKETSARMTQREYLRIAGAFIEVDYAKDGLTIYEDMVHHHTRAFDGLSRDELLTILDNVQRIQSTAASKISHKGREFEDGRLVRVTERIMKLVPDDKKDPILCGNWVRNLANIGKADAAMRTMHKLHDLLGISFTSSTYNQILASLIRADRFKDFNALSVAMIRQAVLRARPLRINQFGLLNPVVEANIEEGLGALGAYKPLSMGLRRDTHLASAEQAGENLVARTIQHAPWADDDTFGLCYRHYSKGGNTLKLRALLDLMAASKIVPTIALFNHLLHALARKDDLAGVWAAFIARRPLFKDEYIPNFATYRLLWDGMRKQLYVPNHRSDYGRPREIFAFMIEDNVSPILYGPAGPKPDRNFYNSMVKSFFQHCDPVGGFVAMNAAEAMWKISPGIISIGNLIKGCARLKSFDHHIGRAMHSIAYRAVRQRAAEWLDKWAGPPLEKPESFRQKKWKWRLKRQKDWEEVVKDLPVHERPYAKYAPTEKDLAKDSQSIDDPSQALVRKLGKLYYGVDDVVPDPEAYLSRMQGFLFNELLGLKNQRDWHVELKQAVVDMKLDHLIHKMPVIEKLLRAPSKDLNRRIAPTTW